MQCDPSAHLPDRPEAPDAQSASLRDIRVDDRLPGGGEHVGEVEEAFVGRAFGYLYGTEVRLGDAQVLGLPAGDRAVDVGVAEQARALAPPEQARRLGELAPVSRPLALGVELPVAEVAVPARDVERDDDPVSGLYVLHVGPDLLDDAHRLVPEDVALPHDRTEFAVQVEVRAADGGRGDADDGVRRLLDHGVGHFVHPHVLFAVPHDGLHGSLLPTPVSISRTRNGPLVCLESGGVSRSAPVRSPSSRSSSASSALRCGVQPSSVRARVVSITGTLRAMSSHPGVTGCRRSLQASSPPARAALAGTGSGRASRLRLTSWASSTGSAATLTAPRTSLTSASRKASPTSEEWTTWPRRFSISGIRLIRLGRTRMPGRKGPAKSRRMPCAASFLKTSAGRTLTTRTSGFSASKRSSLLSTSALCRA